VLQPRIVSPPDIIERRDGARTYCGAQAICRPLKANGQRSFRVNVLDISANGIGLSAPQRLVIGETIVIELFIGEVLAFTQQAGVRWSEPTLDGAFRLGCTWLTPLSEAELLRWA
jgi:hypothetical protein